MSVELIDELEAGELSVELEGEEPQTVLEWAIERFAPRLALSTAFQIDGVALLDMAYQIDPEIQVFSVDTGRMPQETFELIEQLRERYPGLNLTLLSPTAQHIAIPPTTASSRNSGRSGNGAPTAMLIPNSSAVCTSPSTAVGTSSPTTTAGSDASPVRNRLRYRSWRRETSEVVTVM